MPAPQAQYFNFAAGTVNLPNATETVLATTRGVSSSYPNCVFGLLFIFAITFGAGATGVAIQVRRGTLTGTSIFGPTTYATVASVTTGYAIGLTDSIVGEVATQAYVLTCSVTGGAVAGTGLNVYTSVTVAE